MSAPPGIERSRRELAAARLLAESSFGAQAISIDPLAGKLLRSLFRQRQEADYGSADASEAAAATAVADAERFVDAVERWLAAATGRERGA